METRIEEMELELLELGLSPEEIYEEDDDDDEDYQEEDDDDEDNKGKAETIQNVS